MRMSRITGRVELLEKLSQLLSTRVVQADIEEGETIRALPDGSARAKRNGTASLRITIEGGARDN